MKINRNFSFRKLFYNKRFVLAFSLIFAFVFWLIISIEQNPERSRTFNNVPVTVNTQGSAMESLGINIINDISEKNVSVTVFGPNYVVNSLKSDDIVITASVAEVTSPGTYDLKLTAHQNGSEDGYTFSNISPSTIRVTFDYVDTKEFQVTAKADGVSVAVDSNLVREDPLISDAENSTITVKGPRSVVQKIASVVAITEEKVALSATAKFDAEIMLLDSSGNSIDKSNIILSTETVSIMVPISKKVTLNVVPTFKNLTDEGVLDILSYSLSVNNVVVIGPPATIESMSEVTLEPIDIREITAKNNSFSRKAILPDGVKLQDNIESVNVKFNTSSFSEKTLNISNVQFENLSENVKISEFSSIKNVKICGRASDIKKISATNLVAVADLSGKTAGEYIVDVKIKSEKYPFVWQTGTYTVSVTIK